MDDDNNDDDHDDDNESQHAVDDINVTDDQNFNEHDLKSYLLQKVTDYNQYRFYLRTRMYDLVWEENSNVKELVLIGLLMWVFVCCLCSYMLWRRKRYSSLGKNNNDNSHLGGESLSSIVILTSNKLQKQF